MKFSPVSLVGRVGGPIPYASPSPAFLGLLKTPLAAIGG